MDLFGKIELAVILLFNTWMNERQINRKPEISCSPQSCCNNWRDLWSNGLALLPTIMCTKDAKLKPMLLAYMDGHQTFHYMSFAWGLSQICLANNDIASSMCDFPDPRLNIFKVPKQVQPYKQVGRLLIVTATTHPLTLVWLSSCSRGHSLEKNVKDML